MKLYTNATGTRYHTESCPHADLNREWVWAAGKSDREVWGTWEYGRYACLVCKPLGVKSDLMQPASGREYAAHLEQPEVTQ